MYIKFKSCFLYLNCNYTTLVLILTDLTARTAERLQRVGSVTEFLFATWAT